MSMSRQKQYEQSASVFCLIQISSALSQVDWLDHAGKPTDGPEASAVSSFSTAERQAAADLSGRRLAKPEAKAKEMLYYNIL